MVVRTAAAVAARVWAVPEVMAAAAALATQATAAAVVATSLPMVRVADQAVEPAPVAVLAVLVFSVGYILRSIPILPPSMLAALPMVAVADRAGDMLAMDRLVDLLAATTADTVRRAAEAAAR